MRVLQQVGAVLGGEAVRLPPAVGRGRGRGRGRRHGGGGGGEDAERRAGRRGGGGEAMAKEKSGEHWSWRKGEGAGKVGEDRRGSGGGHVDCASTDTCVDGATRSGSWQRAVLPCHLLDAFVLVMFSTEKKWVNLKKDFNPVRKSLVVPWKE